MRLYVLLIAHMLADFTLQTDEMARRKKKEPKFLRHHCAIYSIVMAVGCFSCMGISSAFGMIVLFGITHFLIDWVRTKYDGKFETGESVQAENESGAKSEDRNMKALVSFLIDQVLHIGIILFACWLLRNQKLEGWLVTLTKNAELKQFLREILWEGCTLDQLLRYSLLFVMIMDPASVLIKKLSDVVSVKKNDKSNETGEGESGELGQDHASIAGVDPNTHPESTGEDNPDQNNTVSEADHEKNHAGSLIGKLERLIIVLLVMYDGYGGIGLVLAAKSMARHKKLEEQEFAESYLVGTLSSTAIAMVLAQLLG